MVPEQEVSRGRAALVGVVTAAIAVAAGHLVAAIVAPGGSPLTAVGQTAIDLAPPWLKEFAIETFGANDKRALLWGMLAVLVIAAALLGIAARRRPVVGYAGLGLLGAIGAAAAVTRAGAGPTWALPGLAAAGAGALAFDLLRPRAVTQPRPARPTATGSPAAAPPAAEPSGSFDRRRFFRSVAGGLVLATVAGGLGEYLIRRTHAGESRAAVRVPRPSSAATGDTTAGGLDIEGTEPFFTPNDAFYKVDTTFVTPSVMAEDWRLRIHGMLERPITLTYDELTSRPLIERDVTLACVSNPVGGEYIGNARWIGAPLAPLLEEAGIDPAADQLVSTSVDGWTCGTPTAIVMDGRDAMLAVAMNGEPLPLAHGFPVRMVVPGLYGYVSATKWVVDIEATTFDAFDAYWVRRGWAQQAAIKTQSRIDVPRGDSSPAAGEVVVAGIAWAQHRGIAKVEVRADGGDWAEADLAAEDTPDTWRLWSYSWKATPGEHRLEVRATDGDGATQPEEIAPPFPDGATGYHAVVVQVA
jgi:DMSO/TMAO reductase YedYZ molybdopterin-dependent catalytic subunit